MALSKEFNLNDIVSGKFAGVALIISNDYIGCQGVSVLRGTHKDSAKLEKVFQQFQYFVHKEENATLKKMESLLKTLSDCNYPLTCQRLVFAFSGHGNDGILVCQDGREERIKDMIDGFKPRVAKNDSLSHMARIFFIDACRGSEKDLGYTARGDDGNDDCKCLRRIEFPNEGNMLVAYSSTRYHCSYENNTGGVWTSYLANELAKSVKGSRRGLSEILYAVNAKMCEEKIEGKYFQVGEFISSLREEVYFVNDTMKRYINMC